MVAFEANGVFNRGVNDMPESKKVMVIHGPNINQLGRREPELYGTKRLPDVNQELMELGQRLGLNVSTIQSNSEGEIIDSIQSAELNGFSAIIINPAGYTNTSIAIRDAIAGATLPAVEVHITNVFAREQFRQTMMTTGACTGMVCGFGVGSYAIALRAVSSALGGNE